MWRNVASWTIFLGSAAVLYVLIWRWLRGSRSQAIATELSASRTEERWSLTVLLLLRETCDVIIGHRRFTTRAGRSFAISVPLLIMMLSLAGLLSDSFMGFSKAPWHAFDTFISDLQNEVRERPESLQKGGLLDSDLLERAKHPVWKYAYTAVAAALTVVTHFLSLWLALRLTRRWVVEISTAKSWMQKAALLAVLSVAVLLLVCAAMIVIGLVSSPAIGLVILFGKVGDWLMAAIFALVGAVLGWLGDPWFRASSASAVFPCIAFLALTGAALVGDLQRAARNRARQTALDSVHRTFGPAGAPLVIVALTLLFAAWALKALLVP